MAERFVKAIKSEQKGKTKCNNPLGDGDVMVQCSVSIVIGIVIITKYLKFVEFVEVLS